MLWLNPQTALKTMKTYFDLYTDGNTWLRDPLSPVSATSSPTKLSLIVRKRNVWEEKKRCPHPHRAAATTSCFNPLLPARLPVASSPTTASPPGATQNPEPRTQAVLQRMRPRVLSLFSPSRHFILTLFLMFLYWLGHFTRHRITANKNKWYENV